MTYIFERRSTYDASLVRVTDVKGGHINLPSADQSVN